MRALGLLLVVGEAPVAAAEPATARPPTKPQSEQAGHVSMDVQPALPPMGEMPSRRPARNPGVAMKWHGWAAERMWEGLVGPSDDRWMRGTATFVELPGCGEPGPSARDDAVSERCRTTRALAQRAHVAPTLTDRAEIYGKLLGTCAACHTAANVSQAAENRL